MPARLKTKEELLEHYAEKKSPTKFIQWDVFTEDFDDVVIPDEDGYSIWNSRTQELMTGIYTIRVLIRPDIEKEIAIKGLKKIIESIEKSPKFLQWSFYEGRFGLFIGSRPKKSQKSHH